MTATVALRRRQPDIIKTIGGTPWASAAAWLLSRQTLDHASGHVLGRMPCRHATQLAIAWVLAKDARIVPLIGARTRAQVDEALGALDVVLSADDLARIEDAVPAADVAGTRYDEHQMRVLGSER